MSFGYFYGDQSESYSFYRFPKQLLVGDQFKRLSMDARVLYGLMLDRMGPYKTLASIESLLN